MKEPKDEAGFEVLGGAKQDDFDRQRQRRRARINGYDGDSVGIVSEEESVGDSQPDEGGFVTRNNIMERI